MQLLHIRSKLFYLFLLSLLFFNAPLMAQSLTDDDGQIVTIQKPFQRIISLYAAHTINLIDLGLEKEIIAVSRSDKQIKGLPKVGYRDDPERLLALQPDLVLIRPMISRAVPQLIKRLRLSGVTVVSLQPTSIKGLFHYWQQLATLTGKQPAASLLTQRFQTELAAIQAKIATIPMEKRPRVYFESIHRRMKTFAPTGMAMFCLENGGGINVATDAPQLRNTNIAAYSKERIVAKAEEIDVFLAQNGRMNRVSVEDIAQEPGFQVIKAVREGRIYLVDEKLVSRPTSRLLIGIKSIADILHPGLLSPSLSDRKDLKNKTATTHDKQNG